MAMPMIAKFEDVLTPPLSLETTRTVAPASKSGDGMCHYASARDLRGSDIMNTVEYNEENDDNGGDEMIDVKADELIAQFYVQMRIQNTHYMNTDNRKVDHLY